MKSYGLHKINPNNVHNSKLNTCLAFQIKGELLATPIKLKEEPKSLADSVKQKFENHENIPEPKSVSKSPTKLLFQSSAPSIETGNGLRSRKPCNCTRSQCLKL